ncbi:helix-turn-helix transcriptional regulator [Plantactinospora soyae]|uniref:DNA-binding transcriptional regulator AlpA n=1 Tax=Plantactinospora soyae TaxID=1544732 RepID=A0A927M4Q8_9ACTN|nr:hypothetical protein [Plantactinospora soyae]MBE1484435.1 putative DNA-binding transcriptional regulator AlpA [Plantactinospora soyae]
MPADRPPGPLAGPAEVMELLGGVSRSRLKQITANPKFPKPYQVLTAGAIWLRSDVEEYIRKHRPHQRQVDDGP